MRSLFARDSLVENSYSPSTPIVLHSSDSPDSVAKQIIITLSNLKANLNPVLQTNALQCKQR